MCESYIYTLSNLISTIHMVLKGDIMNGSMSEMVCGKIKMFLNKTPHTLFGALTVNGPGGIRVVRTRYTRLHIMEWNNLNILVLVWYSPEWPTNLNENLGKFVSQSTCPYQNLDDYSTSFRSTCMALFLCVVVHDRAVQRETERLVHKIGIHLSCSCCWIYKDNP